MNYREIKPCQFSENYIKCFWSSETGDVEVYNTILPDGYFDLIVEYTNGKISLVKLTGIWSKPVNVVTNSNTKLFSIRFKLLAAEYLFNREIKSILNSIQILPLEFWNLNNFKGDSFEKFVVHITQYIKNDLELEENIDDKKIKLFDLAYSNNIFSVSKISQEICWSSRQINRYFNKTFGISLKEFLDIIRFRKNFKNISEGKLYPESKYFDQSHFIKEIKKYSGVTPKELYRNDRFLQLKNLKK